MNQARVAEINSHPVRCIERHPLGNADLLRRGFVLRFPSESVVVAAVAEMQETAHGQQKIERRLEWRAQRWLAIGIAASGQLSLLIHGSDQREPAGQVVVAKTARGILHVRLEMKNSVAILVCAESASLQPGSAPETATRASPAWGSACRGASEKFMVAGEITAVEQRNGELDIVTVEAVAF